MADPTTLSSSSVRASASASGPEQVSVAKAQSAPLKQPIKTGAAARVPSRKAANYSTAPFWTGLMLSMGWVAVVIFAMVNASGMQSFAGLSLTTWAIGISAIVSPVAMIWMVAAYMQRAADVQSVTEPLRRQLAMITGESGAAEIRVRRFNQAIKEQLELLRSTKHFGDKELMAIIERINAHKIDLEQFEKQSLYQVQEIQDIIHRSMQHVEKLMDDKFSMLRVLDGKLVQSGDSVARQTDGMRENIAKILEEVETHSLTIASSIERAMKDSKKLSDTTNAQEASLVSAAEAASATLQELSGRIDTDIAHFLGRTGLAREEAERLASAFDAQTRSLEELSTVVPSRIGEAEAVLRGVADRLYTCEQLAREQATTLSDRLGERTEGLESLLERFTARVGLVDNALRQRQMDLDGLVVRVSGASNDLSQQLETYLETLSARAEDALRRFGAANVEAKRGTDAVAAQIAQTASQYEEATRRLEAVSGANAARVKETSAEIAAQLTQFQTLQKASQEAGAEVQQKAGQALSNLQQVLEKLLATRDATQSVSAALTEKLAKASAANEQIIARINDAARTSAQALDAAAQDLAVRETDITRKAGDAESSLRGIIAQLQQQAQDAERVLRAQGTSLSGLLEEVRGRLDATDRRLQDFADLATAPLQQVVDKIEQSTVKGRESAARYTGDLQAQLDHLQQFNGRIGAMGAEVGKMTSETLDSIETMNRRFDDVRAAQNEATKAALAQFDSVAARLQREAESLGSGVGHVATTLQTAAEQVGRQCATLHAEAQDSGAKITAVTGVLQNEARAVRKMLEEQAVEINAQLSQSGTRFEELGRALREKTDAAYALLDRVATRYNEITGEAATAFENRAEVLERKAGEATGRVVSLTQAMEANLGLIDHGTTRIQAGAGVIAASSDKTVDRLDQLNAKLSTVHVTAVDGTTKVLEKMEEASRAFHRVSEGVNDTAETSIALVSKAGTVFGEQASHLLDVSHQIEGSVRSLGDATAAFAGQSADIRSAMEQHNGRLISYLRDSISQIDGASARLQEASASAVVSVDSTASRYDDLAARASMRLDETSRAVLRIAGDTDTALEALGTSVAKQVSALTIASEQIVEQHKTLAQANEAQRTQLLDLFEKLGAAHAEASDVAEKTIARLDNVLGKVQDHLGSLDTRAQTSLAGITDANDGFAKETGKLVAHAQKAEEQARAAIVVTQALQEQAGKLHIALREETGRAGVMLSNLLESLTSGSGTMRDVAATSTMALDDLRENIARQTSALNDSMDKIAGRQETLGKALEIQRETLGGLVARLVSAQDETACVAERVAGRLADSAAGIEAHITTLDARAQDSLATLRTANESFAKESEALAQNARGAEKQAGTLVEATVSMGRQVADTCRTLKNQAQESEQTLLSAAEKIGDQTTKLRDVGSTAEMVLEALSGSVRKETTALDETLGRVMEKQETLGAALDSQRETLSGMMTRLALAQDETAAAAERSISRLTDGAGQVARQMEKLDTGAQSALASVHAATEGFTEETSKIAQQAEKAEHRLRDAVSAAGAMRTETGEIRQVMEGETGKIIAQVGAVVAQLSSTIEDIKRQGDVARNVVDKSALDLAAMGKNANEALEKNAERLGVIAEKAHGTLDSVSDKIRQGAKLMEDASTLSNEHGLRLTETAEKTTSQLVTLISKMMDSDATTREILGNAEKRLTATRVTLETELQNIADLSGRAVEQVMGAGSALAIQSDALRANLSGSESALTAAADMVRNETAQIPNVLGRSVKEIEAAAKAFKTHTTDVAQTMLQSTDRCIGATGAIRDTMTEEARHLALTAEEATQTLSRLNEALMAQIVSVKSGTEALAGERKDMIEGASRTVEQLDQAKERLARIHAEALDSTTKLAHMFDGIEHKAEDTAKRLSGAGESLVAQVDQLVAVTEKAEGQMGKASKGFREQLEAVRSGVQTQIDDINRGLMQITAQLDRTGTSLRAALAGTVVDVEKIAGRFDQTSKDTASQLTDRTARMRVATEEVSRLMNGFGTQIDVLLDRLSLAGDGIKRHEGDLVGHLQKAFTHLGSVAEKLDSARVLTANVSDAATSKLSEVAQIVEKQMRGMAEGGQKVASIIQTVAQTYVDQTQKVNNSVLSSQDQIMVMNKSIEDMQLRADRMRVALKLQGDDLLDSLEQVLSKLDQAGGAMANAVDGSMQDIAMQSLKKIGS